MVCKQITVSTFIIKRGKCEETFNTNAQPFHSCLYKINDLAVSNVKSTHSLMD